MTVDADAIARVACDEYGASQRRDELAGAVRALASIEPRTIVEIGCDAGGTLYAWRQICDRVYGITLSDNGFATGGSGKTLTHHGAKVYIGDSHSPEALLWVQRELDWQRACAVVIDGDHSVQGVYDDIAMYAPLVRAGGLVLLHDIVVVHDERAKVWKVWPEFEESAEFETSRIVSTAGETAYGWGVIRVRGGEPWD